MADYEHVQQLVQSKEYSAAEQYCLGVTQGGSRDQRMYFMLARAREGLEKLDEAIKAYEQAIALDVDYIPALVNLSELLIRHNRVDEAIRHLQHAFRVSGDPAVEQALGNAYSDAGNLENAQLHLRRSIERFNTACARFDYGLLQLAGGDYEHGWKNYTAHWEMNPGVNAPEWQPGNPCQRVLIWNDHGAGDLIQMFRYSLLGPLRANKLIIPSSDDLASLLRHQGNALITTRNENMPEFDSQVNWMRLPALFGSAIDTIPSNVPYLVPEPGLVESWKHKIDASVFSIGICWQGNPDNTRDPLRSFPLDSMRPLFDVPGTRFYSIQAGDGMNQLDRSFRLTDLGRDLATFHDTAAVMKNLDLVITCDSAPAHLAGAVGTQVWVALSKSIDWRWGADGMSNAWYPNVMRLFPQRTLGDWSEVFARMAGELKLHVHRR